MLCIEPRAEVPFLTPCHLRAELHKLTLFEWRRQHPISFSRYHSITKSQADFAVPEDTAIVKFQTIVREGKEIVVGRIKVPTPGSSSHAFILRRYDTQAISLTTMYKVAFPEAPDEDEKREMDWVSLSGDHTDK